MPVRVLGAPFVLLGGDIPPVADGAVALDGDRILAAGPRPELEARFSRAEPVDGVILPALVNAHLHLELSHLAGQVPGGAGLVPWIRALVAARMRAGPVEEAMARAAASLAEAGVAAVGDVTNTLGSMRHLARHGMSGTLYHEVFGFTADRVAEALRAAAEVRSRLGDPPPGLAVAPSPHAVYSTHGETVARLLRAGPASIHVAEDPGEREFCAAAAGPFAELVLKLGLSPGELRPCARSAVAAVAPHLGARSLVVHAVDVDEEDLRLLGGSGATVVLCPRSNLRIGGRVADLPRLLAAGLPLAVGTDSLASSPSLSPLAELAALHRAFPQVPPARLLPLAWNGAAVGAAAVGRLSPGSSPGVVAAPLLGARPADPAAWLLEVHAAEERPVTWLARHRPGPPS
ncbi:MAG TPA: amidohydrolase family protein [Anaeromyxobacteraceae bacterium]|nr:amidohydrolase family protein [Anaeromyxobacteraceae bacterium]